MILVIDNYDSFTYNIISILEKLKQKVIVLKNDSNNLLEIDIENISSVIISPGPGRPEDTGHCLRFLKKHYKSLPILGICLGHQCIAKLFSLEVIQCSNMSHGEVDKIFHNRNQLFNNISSPFKATRYHSLIVKGETKQIEITSKLSTGEIMGIAHKSFPIFGLQFHPESYGTKKGEKILENFINISKGIK